MNGGRYHQRVTARQVGSGTALDAEATTGLSAQSMCVHIVVLSVDKGCCMCEYGAIGTYRMTNVAPAMQAAAVSVHV